MIALVLFACTDATAPESDSEIAGTLPSETEGSTESGDAPAAAATSNETTFTVTWETSEPSDGWVEYGIDGAFDHLVDATDSDDGLSHEATLTALAAGETWDYRTVDHFEADDSTSAAGEVEVPAAPEGLPELQITIDDGDRAGFILGTSPFAGSDTAVWVADRQGRYVWWNIEKTSGTGQDATTEAWLSADGEWVEWIKGMPGQAIQRMRLDKTASEQVSVPNIHHDFIPMAKGGWLTISQRQGTMDDRQIIADQIDWVMPDGTTTEVFSSWNRLALDPSTGEDLGYAIDCTHFNGLFYDAEEENVYVSSWVRNSVLVVNVPTGQLVREIGGAASDLDLTQGRAFEHPHGPRIFPDGTLVVLDNGSTETMSSRVAAFDLDTQTATYAEAWSFEPGIFSSSLGNADPLEDGGAFVSWGVAGRLSELDAEHNEIWRADASLGGIFGYAHLIPSFLGQTD